MCILEGLPASKEKKKKKIKAFIIQKNQFIKIVMFLNPDSNWTVRNIF